MTHEEASELLGAFALDAVDVDDDVAVREHLDSCVRCESEVAQFHEIAGLLANTGGDAPQHMWDRIAEQVVFRAPPAPERKIRWTMSRIGRTGLRFVVPLGTAAALVVIAVLGLQVEHLNHRIGRVAALSANAGIAQEVQAALLDPQAKQIELTSIAASGSSDENGSAAAAELVMLPSGTGFLVNHRLPALPPSETYQLWGLTGGRLISIGLLGNRPSDVAMTIGQPAPFVGFAITAEHNGGSVKPTLPAVAASSSVSA
jgi:anti-sigma-K factor RskA